MQRRLEPSDLGLEALSGVEQLLAEGGDQRILLDPASGLNRYQCAPRPDPELAAFGSSTASTISAVSFAAAQSLAERIGEELERRPAAAVYERRIEALRIELLRLCGLEARRGLEVLLAPSGTDLHLFVSHLISAPGRPALAIIGEPAETGSGVPVALAGGVAPVAEVVSVAARAADGGLRNEASVDAEVEALVVRAVAELRRVLIVITDVSKTGLISPSLAGARELARRFPGWVDVLVDACQMRLSPRTLSAYADLGWMIAVTGSKFLTGPAFSGALFIPRKLADRLKRRRLPKDLRALSVRADWPSGWAAGEGLEEAPNFGLLVRWEAAMAELRAFREVPDDQARAFLGKFEQTTLAALAADPALEPLAGRRPLRDPLPPGGWDQAPSIFPFLLKSSGRRLTPEQTQRVYALLRQDLSGHARAGNAPVVQMAAGLRVELGQSVACGVRGGAPVAALRMCASARLISEACSSASAAEAILLRVKLALAKASCLAADVADGRL